MMLRWPFILICLVALGATFQDKPASKSDSGPGASFPTFTRDGAWCWFADPRAIFHEGTRRKTYAGWVDFSEGAVHVASLDHDSGQLQTSRLKMLHKDDHANPALLVRPDGKLMLFYSAHNGEKLFYQISRRPENIHQWEAEQEVSSNVGSSHGYTYPNPFYLASERRYYLFWRGGDWQPTFVTSGDGRTWSEPRELIQVSGERPYIKFVSNDRDSFHFAFTDGHPRNVNNNVYYAQYRDGWFYRADGSPIKSFDNLPLTSADAEKIYDAEVAGKAWIWDVALDDQEKPVIVYATFLDDADHRYRYASWDGDEWRENQITSAGGSIDGPREPNYSGGVVLDHTDPAVVYLSREVDGIHEIEIWQTSDGGQNWTSKSLTRSSRLSNVRPVSPRGHPPGEVQVMWMHGRYVHYTDYHTSIRFYPPISER